MPKVSVIIPTYNRSNLVKDAICSVLAQNESDLEVIVVDDGSTDGTCKVVEDLRDGRVNYFYKINGGAASARNLGLSKCKGEYVAFLDSDDFWPENYLEVMISHLENNGEFGAAYSPITLIHSDGTQIESYKKPDGNSGWLTVDLFKTSFVWIFAAVFHSSVWKDFYFDELLTKVCEDSDAILRLSIRTKFLFVPEIEAFHRISADSISSEVAAGYTRMLALERFYFKLGGDKIVPAGIARRRLSHSCRKVAEDHRSKMSKVAALELYKRAIQYWPCDLRLYIGLFKTLLLNSGKAKETNWEMPEPLCDPVGTNRFV